MNGCLYLLIKISFFKKIFRQQNVVLTGHSNDTSKVTKCLLWCILSVVSLNKSCFPLFSYNFLHIPTNSTTIFNKRKAYLYAVSIPTYIGRFHYADVSPNNHASVYVLHRADGTRSSTNVMLVQWLLGHGSSAAKNCKSHIPFQDIKVPSNHTASFWYLHQHLKKIKKKEKKTKKMWVAVYHNFDILKFYTTS